MMLAGAAALLGTLILAAVVNAMVRGEYAWWGARASAWAVRVAARLQPRDDRGRFRAEWLADLEALREQEGVPGLFWAASTCIASARIALPNHVRARRERRSSSLDEFVEVFVFADDEGSAIVQVERDGNMLPPSRDVMQNLVNMVAPDATLFARHMKVYSTPTDGTRSVVRLRVPRARGAVPFHTPHGPKKSVNP